MASRGNARADAALPSGCRLADNQAQIEREVLREINATRAAHRLGPLEHDGRLQANARSVACDNARRQHLDHRMANGSDTVARARGVGYAYRLVSENLAYGQRNPQSVVSAWMRSPGHRRNLLDPNARDYGGALAIAPNGALYWSAVHGAEH